MSGDEPITADESAEIENSKMAERLTHAFVFKKTLAASSIQGPKSVKMSLRRTYDSLYSQRIRLVESGRGSQQVSSDYDDRG